MIDSIGTGPYAIMATCKYRLPCGYCELKKRICTADNPFTITPTLNDATPIDKAREDYKEEESKC